MLVRLKVLRLLTNMVSKVFIHKSTGVWCATDNQCTRTSTIWNEGTAFGADQLTNSGRDKMPPICIRRFQMHFLRWQLSYFYWNLSSNWRQTSIGLDNALLPHYGQIKESCWVLPKGPKALTGFSLCCCLYAYLCTLMWDYCDDSFIAIWMAWCRTSDKPSSETMLA